MYIYLRYSITPYHALTNDDKERESIHQGQATSLLVAVIIVPIVL